LVELPPPEPVGNGTGAAVNVNGLECLTYQVSGTFVATDVEIWGSLDGVNFENVVASISAPIVDAIGGIYFALQLRIAGYTSGTPVVKVLGHDVNAN
jgi:hypothetical protein